MARRRRNTWVVKPTQDGTCALERNGRPLADQLSERTMRQYLRRRSRDSDRIQIEEDDGYRRPAELSDHTFHRRKV